MKIIFNSEENLNSKNETWKCTDSDIYAKTSNEDGSYLLSNIKASDFLYISTIKFHANKGEASLVFRSRDIDSIKNCYLVSVNAETNKCRLSKKEAGELYPLSNEYELPKMEDYSYEIKIIAIKGWISVYVENKLIASLGDYILTHEEYGQNTYIDEGYLGVYCLNSEVEFTNTDYYEITNHNSPLLRDITVLPKTGKIESKSQFIQQEPVTICYVTNDVETIDIIPTKLNNATNIKVLGTDGEYNLGKNIPIKDGKNIFSVLASVLLEDNITIDVIYRVNVHRRRSIESYQKEIYRPHYHYSVKDGWANDPNGLVFFRGKYHLFYQFYDDIVWGSMHWAHATSTDLLHWKDEGITFFPDANGTMYSGCIAVDDKNYSNLFNTDKGGLVAFITCNGNGQRIKIAYSEDEGNTWKKMDKIILDWTNDPLKVKDFRDPKVFRFENKWFMVIAGGPFRIYSSNNLIDWVCESSYPELHTECPDLYPIKTLNNKLKWVLSRGGRLYKIGDFNNNNGNWKFIPDEEYVDKDGIMNFGKDSYAAMTFYIQDFGTNSEPTIPEIYEINWMNTWQDYCNKVAKEIDQDFNGVFNLTLKLGLIEENGKYILTQKPIAIYEHLRSEPAVNYKNIVIGENNRLLADFYNDCYEIIATFKLGNRTNKVGFNIRSSELETTKIIYDNDDKNISIDRSNSGISLGERFNEIDKQDITILKDNTINMHLFVDKSSVEVFLNGYTICGANQIFPKETSNGIGIIVEGEDVTADIVVYPIKKI